jgi:ribosomal protein S12 methylthiotransferase accessory factor
LTGAINHLTRGQRKAIKLRRLFVRYKENGWRSAALEETLATVDSFFLANEFEVQFRVLRRAFDQPALSTLEVLSPRSVEGVERYFGKGATSGQAFVSACLEFVERQSARMSEDDLLVEASYNDVASRARDPRSFALAPGSYDGCGQAIDWIWGYSLTKSETVMVPANLVYLPYKGDRSDKLIAWPDSNGLASGNNLEEAILHGLLEVIERDAVVIAEFNRLPQAEIMVKSAPPEVVDAVESVVGYRYRSRFRTVPTDIPIPVISTFLEDTKNPENCSVAFGCHLDPALALMRSLTEAIQLLPPSVNHRKWFQSESYWRFATEASRKYHFPDMENQDSVDLKSTIETCVDVLSTSGSEVIIVDLSDPETPFSTVRVLCNGLQPLVHEGDRRLSQRFFDVPMSLGHRSKPVDPQSVAIWPLVGYR